MPANHTILCLPLFLLPSIFPSIVPFQMSQLFAWGGRSIGVSAATSVFPMNTQDWSPLGWNGWISLQSKGLSRIFSNTKVQSINSLALSFLYISTFRYIHDYWKNHRLYSVQFSSVQFSSVIQLCLTLCDPMDWSTPGLPLHHQLLEFTQTHMSIESVMPSSYFTLCHPFLLLPSIFTTIRVFSSEPTLCIRWPKYWSFSFNISPSNELSGLISFTMDWLNILVVQRTLPKKIKSVTVSPSICLQVMGPDVMILVFWMLSFKPTFSLSFFTFI